VHWWRAQSLRFMLRWPSAYLCHVSNRVRQQAYGLHVAVRIEEARAAQKRILESLSAAAAVNGGDAAAGDDSRAAQNETTVATAAAAVASTSAGSTSAEATSTSAAASASVAINATEEAASLQSISFLDTSSLATSIWPSIGFAGCSPNDDNDDKEKTPKFRKAGMDAAKGQRWEEGEVGGGGKGEKSRGGGKALAKEEGEGAGDEEGEDEEEVYRRVGGEVYMPRPVVSVHVRQGDKQKEMKLSSFKAYMLHVQRLRLRVPDMHYVWLSTEMQVSCTSRYMSFS
ncbi:unnamed protein product, partial [Closterium sp. NIES-53]